MSESPTKAVPPNTGHESMPSDSMIHHVWDEIVTTPGGLTAISVVVVAFLGYLGIRHRQKHHV